MTPPNDEHSSDQRAEDRNGMDYRRERFNDMPVFLRNMDFKTFLIVLTMVFGWAGSWYTMSARASDTDRRVTTLERELVPRTEHDIRDAALQERLRGIEIRLQDIQTHLNRIPEK